MRLARLKVETPAPDVSRGILPSPTTCWWYDRLLQRIMFNFSSRNACLHPSQEDLAMQASMLSFREANCGATVNGRWITHNKHPYRDSQRRGAMSESDDACTSASAMPATDLVLPIRTGGATAVFVQPLPADPHGGAGSYYRFKRGGNWDHPPAGKARRVQACRGRERDAARSRPSDFLFIMAVCARIMTWYTRM